MRAQVDVVEDTGVLRIELLENLMPGEIRPLADAISRSDGFRPGVRVLIDLRALTEYPNDDDIAVMASKCRLLWLAGTLGCTALVVQRDGFRVARTFQIHSGDGDPRLAIFRNPDDALRWLTMDKVRYVVPPMVSAVA